MNGNIDAKARQVIEQIGPCEDIGKCAITEEHPDGLRESKTNIKHYIANLIDPELCELRLQRLLALEFSFHVNLNSLQSENDHDQQDDVYDLKPVK